MTAPPEITSPDGAILGALLERTANGDQDAFRCLYAATAGSVFLLVHRMIRDAAQSEEVVQEIFLEVWSSAARYTASRGTVLPWLHTIARRRAIDRIRASQASRERDHRVGIREQHTPYDDVVDALEGQASADHLGNLLAQLTDLDRNLVTLVHLHGHSYKDAAATFDIPVGTVKSRLHDAMRTLRRLAETI